VPAFADLIAPHWRSGARGVIAGLTGYVTKVRSVSTYRLDLEAEPGGYGRPIDRVAVHQRSIARVGDALRVTASPG
jgi:hypothetical protein